MMFEGDESLSVRERYDENWQKLLDCFGANPKYERVKNYVNFILDSKIEHYLRVIPGLEKHISKYKQQHKLEDPRTVKLEILRQVELHKKLKPILDRKEVEPTQEEMEVLGWKDSLLKLSQDVELQQKFVKRM